MRRGGRRERSKGGGRRGRRDENDGSDESRSSSEDEESEEEIEERGGGSITAGVAALKKKRASGGRRESRRRRMRDEEESDEESDDEEEDEEDEGERDHRRRAETEESMHREREIRARASRKNITSKDLDLDIDGDDFVEGGSSVVLPREKIQDFVSVPMYALQPAGITEQASTTLVRRKHGGKMKDFEEIFVENSISGRFKRILYEMDSQGFRVQKTQRHYDDDEETARRNSPQALRSVVMKAAYVLNAFFLLAQGVLCGASLMQLIIVLQIASEDTLLEVYAPIAMEIRRIFYFLAVLSFVGAYQKYSDDVDNAASWMARSANEKGELIFYVTLYALTLGFTLLCGPEADNMYNTYDAYRRANEGNANPDDGWIAILKADDSFNLKLWKVFAMLRFACATIGWFLLSKDVQRDVSRGRNRLRKIDELRERQEVLLGRIDNFCGRNLSRMTLPELEDLHMLQRTGVEETSIQLKLRKE